MNESLFSVAFRPFDRENAPRSVDLRRDFGGYRRLGAFSEQGSPWQPEGLCPGVVVFLQGSWKGKR